MGGDSPRGRAAHTRQFRRHLHRKLIDPPGINHMMAADPDEVRLCHDPSELPQLRVPGECGVVWCGGLSGCEVGTGIGQVLKHRPAITIVSSNAHMFGPDLGCHRCNTTWKEHQLAMQPCPNTHEYYGEGVRSNMRAVQRLRRKQEARIKSRKR